MPDRLKSRKLWVSAVASLIMMLAPSLGLDIDQGTAATISGGIIAAYGIGQGIADHGKS